MAHIRITKEFYFEMAHALLGYDGLCKNIHGHSYKLFVTIIGEPISDQNNPKLGMVMDFGDLKKIVNDVVVQKYDHSLVLHNKSHLCDIQVNELFGKVHLLNFQPTCENLIADFAENIKKQLPPQIHLYSLKLYETNTSYAEWYQEDNLE